MTAHEHELNSISLIDYKFTLPKYDINNIKIIWKKREIVITNEIQHFERSKAQQMYTVRNNK
jgi:hypothetical protein